MDLTPSPTFSPPDVFPSSSALTPITPVTPGGVGSIGAVGTPTTPNLTPAPIAPTTTMPQTRATPQTSTNITLNLPSQTTEGATGASAKVTTPPPSHEEEAPAPRVVWYKNKWYWVIGLLGFFTLLFFSLWLRARAKKCPTCPSCKCPPCDCPKCPPPTPVSTSSCPVCPVCEKCMHLLWSKLGDGLGATEYGDPGHLTEITSETDTLQKAQAWVLSQKGVAMSYPLVPCVGAACATATTTPSTTGTTPISTPTGSTPGATGGTGGTPTSNFYWTKSAYVRSNPDSNYQSFQLDFK